MAIQTDKQGDQRRIDQLETQIAAEDIVDAAFVGARHAYDVSQYDLCDETAGQA